MTPCRTGCRIEWFPSASAPEKGVRVRSATRWSVLALAVAGSVGCAATPKPLPGSSPAAASAPSPLPTQPGPAAPRAPNAAVTGLVFTVEPLDAQISIDGTPRGTVADLAARQGLLLLAPGIYEVSVTAAGYVTWRAEVALRTGTEPIRVSLARKP